MKLQLSLCLILFATSVLSLTYKVVAPGATTVQVSIAGTLYPMGRVYPDFDAGYFNASVPSATTSQQYKYVVDDVAETFDRIFPDGKKKTYNDFFGRAETRSNGSQLGWPFTEMQQWNRSKGPNNVFNDDYISTIFFVGQNASDVFMNTRAKTKIYGMEIIIITRSDDGYFNQVELNLEDNSQLKPNMKVDLPKNFNSRSVFKLRPSVSDPVFMRDKLYNDILQAAGCPHQEASFTRVYVNNKGLGLYNLMEKPASKDFIKTQFYGDNRAEPTVLGNYLDATTGADFAPDTDIYTFVPSKTGSNARVSELITALANLDTSSDAAIAEFDRVWWSIEHFFRAVALEYLSGHYDSYWFMTTNFLLYDDPTEGGRFYFVDQDFDQTFGINLTPQYNPYGDNYTSIPYTTYVNVVWPSITGFEPPHRVMIDKLIGSNAAYKAKFETILKTLVTGLWNPIALNRRIDTIAARIRPELAWDYALGENRAHLGNATEAVRWTVADFDAGFETNLKGNWGLKYFIRQRANFVAEQFGLTFQDPPLDPPAKPDNGGNDGSSDGTTDGGNTTGNTGNTGNTGTITSATSASTSGTNGQQNDISASTKQIASLAVLAIAFFALAF